MQIRVQITVRGRAYRKACKRVYKRVRRKVRRKIRIKAYKKAYKKAYQIVRDKLFLEGMATNNGTYGVQNDTYAHSLNNNNINIPIATRGGNID